MLERGLSEAFLVGALFLQPLDDVSHTEWPVGEHALHVLIVHQIRLVVVRFSVHLKLLMLQGLNEGLPGIPLFLDDGRQKVDFLKFIFAVEAVRLDEGGSVICASLLIMGNQVSLVE